LPPMTDGGFLSTAFVVTILVGVGALAVLSAVTVGHFDRLERARQAAFFFCLAAIWAGAVLVVYLIRHAL
jgi:hypothetical protein